MSAYRFDDRVKRPNGPWVPSTETDITKTWERARRRLEADALARELKMRQIRQIGLRPVAACVSSSSSSPSSETASVRPFSKERRG